MSSIVWPRDKPEPLLILDVPIHSAIERAFVIELAAVAKAVLFTCPAGDLRTLENLKMVPGAREDAATPEPGDSSLAHLALRAVFRETSCQNSASCSRSRNVSVNKCSHKVKSLSPTYRPVIALHSPVESVKPDCVCAPRSRSLNSLSTANVYS